MAEAKLELSLEASAEEPPIGDPTRQAELKEASRVLKAESGVSVMEMMTLRKAVGAGSEHLGQFLVVAGPAVAAAISAVSAAWLQGRFGRKARLKVGDIEAEARTLEEVEKLVKLAEESQARSAKDGQ